MTTEEMTDIIASLAAQRQADEKDGNAAAARASALQRLQELLDREKEALRTGGPDTDHPANIEALSMEIGKLKAQAATNARLSLPEQRNRAPQQTPPRHAQRGPVRNRGRRTMGRGGGR